METAGHAVDAGGTVIGAVVLVHGSGPNDRDETIGANHPFRDLTWALADRGVAVLRYEKRTHQYPQRMAAIKNLTVRDEVIDDALRAVARLRAHDRIDPKRVFVLGHSLGGMLAPRIGSEDRTVAGLIIMAGATRPFEQIAREQIDYLASVAPASAPADREAALQILMKAAPESYWKDLNAYKPAETAAALTMPILILQGERDYQVTLDDLRGWRAALGGHPGVTIKTYSSLNHLFLPGEGKSTPAECLAARPHTRPGPRRHRAMDRSALIAALRRLDTDHPGDRRASSDVAARPFAVDDHLRGDDDSRAGVASRWRPQPRRQGAALDRQSNRLIACLSAAASDGLG